MTSLDAANTDFWNELCGSRHARSLGVTDDVPESLSRFDNWYFGFYPYLLPMFELHTLPGKRVLEIGLGYGSLSQKLAEAGADYLGLDIAPGPVAMMRHRLTQTALPGSARQLNFLNNGLPDAGFDVVISIGCFHHTGSISRCVDETYRILKKGGIAYVMVYNRHSYRHFLDNPIYTLASAIAERIGHVLKEISEHKNFLIRYDANLKGKIAPHTDFTSISEAKYLFKNFSYIQVWKENCESGNIFGFKWKRDKIRPWLGALAGTDIYIKAIK